MLIYTRKIGGFLLAGEISFGEGVPGGAVYLCIVFCASWGPLSRVEIGGKPPGGSAHFALPPGAPLGLLCGLRERLLCLAALVAQACLNFR